MKKTAVEWYAKQLARIGVTEELIGHLTKEAKQMEKEQIKNSFDNGYYEGSVGGARKGEYYYNETYKSE